LASPVLDVVVAGGGMAGCVLAARLSEDPSRSVCLVEAGPDYGAFVDGRWPADILDGTRLALQSHCWETDRDDRSQLRARILGGCSSHNACAVFAGAPSDYDEWGDGWSHATIEPYLARAKEKLGTRRLEPDELAPWHAAFASAGGDAAMVHDVNMRGTTRWNAAFAYLDDTRGRANLTIRADTLVDRVLFDRDRAVGVTTDHGPIAARTVVLTAGAYGTPAIVLRSGIGPGLAHDLPVGEGLSDHVGVGAAWSPTPLLNRDMERFTVEEGRPAPLGQVTLGLRSSACPPDVVDLFVFSAVEPRLDGGGWDYSAAVFVMKPRSLGTVRLNDLDPRSPVAIDHGFLSDPHDAEVLVEGFGTLRELVAEQDATRRYAAGELRPGTAVGAEEHVRTAVRGFFHPTGTCALGRVVDGRGRVLGVEGLVVSDASFIPSIPRANTNLSVAALAERIAEWI
jgi:choline dehydrogenase